MNETQITLLVVLAPMAVYGLARCIFAAYFSAKGAYLRRFFHVTDQKENGDSSSD